MSPVRGRGINTMFLRGPFKKTHHQKRKKARSVPDRKDPVSGTSPRCSLTDSGFCYLVCQVPPPEKHVETRQTRRISSNQRLLQNRFKTNDRRITRCEKEEVQTETPPLFIKSPARTPRGIARSRRVALTSASATEKNSSTDIIAICQ